MLILTKKKVDAFSAIYYYQPEGKGEKGEVMVDFAAQEMTVINLAENDSPDNDLYITHCCLAIADFFKKDKFPTRKTIRW